MCFTTCVGTVVLADFAAGDFFLAPVAPKSSWLASVLIATVGSTGGSTGGSPLGVPLGVPLG